MHTPHPTPLYPPLTISYRNHQQSVLFTKDGVKRGGHGPMPPLNTLLYEIHALLSNSKGKSTGQRVLSTHCVGHYQLAAHYKYQS